MDTRKLQIDNSAAPAHTVVTGTRFDDANGTRLTLGDREELVRRWNAHAALVAALERAIESLEIGADDSEEAGYPSRAEAMRNDAQAHRTTLEAIKATGA